MVLLKQFLKSFRAKNTANFDVFGTSQAKNQGFVTVVVVVGGGVGVGVGVVVVVVVVVCCLLFVVVVVFVFVFVFVFVVVVGRHKNRAPVETTRNSLEDEMTKPPWTSVVRVCF